MLAKELRDLGADELRVKESDLREELMLLRLRKGTGQSENPMKMHDARKDLARVLTVLRDRQNEEKGVGR